MADINYSDGKTTVMPGDKVRMKRWFRFVDGSVIHVPGISRPRKEFDNYDVQEIAIKTFDGLIYGIVVEPETNMVINSVVFIARGSMPEALPEEIDDPYTDNE